MPSSFHECQKPAAGTWFFWVRHCSPLVYKTHTTAGQRYTGHSRSKLTEPSLAQEGPRLRASGWEEALRARKGAAQDNLC